MELKQPAVVLAVAVLCLALPRAVLSQPQSAPPAVADTPAPAPAPHRVNLTDLLSLAGPYGTFLGYLVRTDAIRTLQSLANATDDGAQGVTVFAPEDSAFAAVDAAALSNLTGDRLRELVLCHAVARYLPLSSFSALAASGPVATLGGCAVNVTYAAGRIRVASGWTAAARLVSSVYSTPPVAVYSLDRVLLPAKVFPTEPNVAPVPAPAPAPPARGADATDGAPAATERGGDKSLSCRVGASRVLVGFLALSAIRFLPSW